LTTLQEYLVDYASPATRTLGERLIQQNLAGLPDGARKQELQRRLQQIVTTPERDLFS
jgi:2-iminoacetate synthase